MTRIHERTMDHVACLSLDRRAQQAGAPLFAAEPPGIRRLQDHCRGRPPKAEVVATKNAPAARLQAKRAAPSGRGSATGAACVRQKRAYSETKRDRARNCLTVCLTGHESVSLSHAVGDCACTMLIATWAGFDVSRASVRIGFDCEASHRRLYAVYVLGPV
jgi:hypothetical protein